MLLSSKEEYMKKLGVSKQEIDSLVPMTFEKFKNLKIGDFVYSIEDLTYFIPVPFKVVSSKWLFSGYDTVTNNGKPFWYKQISFVRGAKTLYADSAGFSFKRLYVKL